MENKNQWLAWAVELQALAQAGLYYGKDIYDIERFQRIRDMAAEMLSQIGELPPEKVKPLFCSENGYQTPKLDSRAAIFREDKILLVQEKDGLWTLPGGWVDAGLTVAENTVKEAREEAGLEVRPERVIALQDKDRDNPPAQAHKICKVFLLCTELGGSFQPNSETVASGWFSLEALPPLATGKTTEKQIKMCFDAYHAEHWEPVFD